MVTGVIFPIKDSKELARVRKLVPESVFVSQFGELNATQVAPFGGVDCTCWEAK